jgi:transcriptional activator protein UGA3
MQEHHLTLHQSPSRRASKLQAYARDRRGCLTCRKRKKKCDNTEGRCQQCLRLNLHCEWEPERYVSAQTRHRSPTWPLDADGHAGAITIIKAPDPLQFWSQATEEKGSPEIWNRRLALRYYIQSFAAILSCNVENNGFLSGKYCEL